jgi:hypothetical protein
MPSEYYEGPEELRPAPNPREFDINPAAARFFVIKSFSEEDVHTSIKYAVWASTDSGNKRLDRAFRDQVARGGVVYLFFSVNASGQFCGMAQMASAVDYSRRVSVWQQAERWRGVFHVRWVFIKDIPNSQFRHIRLENNEGKPVTNSRDTQEVPELPGKDLLRIFYVYKHRSSILDDWMMYELRQRQRQPRSDSSPPAPPAALITATSGAPSISPPPSPPRSRLQSGGGGGGSSRRRSSSSQQQQRHSPRETVMPMAMYPPQATQQQQQQLFAQRHTQTAQHQQSRTHRTYSVGDAPATLFTPYPQSH